MKPDLFTYMDSDQTISQDKVVSLNYILSLDNGEEIDRTTTDEPLVYLHGHENILPALEAKLDGLKVGEKVTATIEAAEAYGDYDEEGLHVIERSLFPEDLELEIGMLLHLKDDNSEELEAFVHAIDQEEITLDTNHPLAGETLTFKVEIVDIRPATAVEIEHGHAHLLEDADHD